MPDSLQTKLLLFVTGAIVVILALATVFVVRARQTIQVQVHHEQAALAGSFAGFIDTFLDGSRGAVESAAAVPQVRAPLQLANIQADLHGVPDDADAQRRTVLQGVVSAFPRFDYTFQLAANGDMYMLQPFALQRALTRNDFAYRDYYQRVLRSGKTSFSNVYISDVSQRPAVAVAVPLFDPAGQLDSVVAGTLNLAALEQAAQAAGGNQTATLLVFDDTGVPIISPDREQRDRALPLTDSPLVQHALAGQAGSWSYFNPQSGQDELGTVLPVSRAPWFVAAVQSRASVFSELDALIGSLVAALGVGLAILVLWGYALSRSLVRNAGALTRTAESLARGDLTLPVKLGGRDEIGRMAAAVHSIIGTLRELVGDLQSVSTELGDASRHLLNAASQQAVSATDQSGAVSQTTAAVEQVSRSADQAIEMATGVTDKAQRANAEVAKGVAATRESFAGMNTMRASVTQIVTTLAVLKDKQQQIDQITVSTSGLADQSHVLALNAAIVAHRAGEPGRAFAVVAEHIQSLTQQSKAATIQVRAILAELNRSAAATIPATERSLQQADRGAELAETTQETIERLALVNQDTAAATQQIAAAVRQHAVAMAQISEAMSHINAGATDNLQASTTSRTAAAGIVRQAERLDDLVSRWRL